MQERRTISPVWVVLAGIGSAQLGAAVAKNLFGRVDPTGVVWLRLATSALVFVVIARPRLHGRTRADWLTVVGFGLALGAMNWSTYQAIARIPLGLAVAIGFSGPLVLAAALSRRPRDLVWVGLAAIGVGLPALGHADLDVAGIGFALLAATMWATYILLSARTGKRWEGVEGLAVASAVAAVLLAPFAVRTAGDALLDPRILVVGATVGLLSSAIPYACDLVALRRIRADVFSILMCLEPAAAALAGMLVLGEFLSPLEWLAVLCVMVASVGATGSRERVAEPVLD
ncbi:MAG TPA: EamA family transporter [Nocardioides sp.]|uniref:EamA family transporter n=1 Tax=Nocardioides sp. TaxID=35761 RepID=UPI002E30E6B9|nr:EamA family transporter [Nocardioides sp.]HEX5089333.1 EamA family transporter [Nocardioides sp.]